MWQLRRTKRGRPTDEEVYGVPSLVAKRRRAPRQVTRALAMDGAAARAAEAERLRSAESLRSAAARPSAPLQPKTPLEELEEACRLETPMLQEVGVSSRDRPRPPRVLRLLATGAEDRRREEAFIRHVSQRFSPSLRRCERAWMPRPRAAQALPPFPGSGSSSSSSPVVSEARRAKLPPGQRFPSVPWASFMCKKLQSELLEAFKGSGLCSRKLRLGTDCAGAEAPVFALREICRELAGCVGRTMEVDHCFACDVDYASREFIARNCLPKALFCDLLARDTISHCMRAEMPRVVPGNLDIYVAGFPCKDFSLLNHNRPGLDGPNAMIFHGVVNYIRRHEPSTYVLENVWGLTLSKHGQAAPIHEVMETLRAIPHYEVRGWKVNTMEFHLPQNRRRIYIVGVHKNKVQLRKPLSKWNELLRGLERTPEVLAHDFILDDDEPEVCAERGRLVEIDRLRRERRAAEQQQGRVKVLRHGLRWVKKHRAVRARLGLLCGVPSLEAAAGGRQGSWSRFLSPRTRDILDLAGVRVGRLAGRRAEESSFFCEISRGLGYATCMDGATPCVTPTCRIWAFNRWRWLIGKEMLALQGFPVEDLDLGGLTEGEVAQLAGNAMTVPAVGAFLLLVLALVHFPGPDTGGWRRAA